MAEPENLVVATKVRKEFGGLIATDNVDFSYQDGHIATWLHDRSPAKLNEAAAAIRSMPDVIASYVRDGGHYERVGPTGAMSGRERSWWVRYGQ